MKRIFYLLSIVVLAVSFLIHMPLLVQETIFGRAIIGEPIYSDAVAWYTTYIVHGKSLSPPYIGYIYPNPPLIGFLFWISYLPIATLGIGYGDPLAISIYYIFYSIIISMIYLVSMKLYGGLIRVSGEYVWVFIFPSYIVYLIYDWSILSLLLIMLFIHGVLREKFLLLTIASGLLVAYNPFFSLLVLASLYVWYVGKRFKLTGYGLFGLLFGAVFYLVVLFLPYGGSSLTSFFNGLFCMNCIYALFIRDIHSQYVKAVSLGVVYASSSILLLMDERGNGVELGYGLEKIIVVFMFGSILWLYMVPQILVYLLPLIYFYLTRIREKILLLTGDLLNSLIIILWFKDVELRKMLSFTRIPVVFDPWSMGSPVQWIAQFRNILLFILLIVVINRTLYLGYKKE